MDRGVMHVLEDEEDEKKPLIGASFSSPTDQITVATSNSTTVAAVVSLNSSDSGQAVGLSIQENLEQSLGSSLHQSASQWQQLMPQQQQQQQPLQQTESGTPKRPNGTSQAISFGALMPMLLPTLQPDQSQKLLSLYQKLKRTEISKEDFLRTTRALVGDQVLVQTVKQLQLKQIQGQIRPQVPAQTEQPLQSPFSSHVQQTSQQQQQQQQQQLKTSSEHLQRQLPSQVQEMGQTHGQQSVQQLQSSVESSAQYQGTAIQTKVVVTSDYRQEQWHMHQAQSLSSSLNLQQVKHDFDKSQGAEISTGHIGSTSSYVASSINMPPTISIPEGVMPFPGAPSSMQVKTPPKKSVGDQKRPADISPIMQGKSKKQKVAGDVLEQSIDQLNDVTAVSGVNLREEEEQLLAGPKEESRSTQAMRRFAQEEEGRLFLEKVPLHMKVMAIASKFGVSLVSEEAEQCLSMCAEERLRTMLYKLSKISSRRFDQEKDTHKTVVTSNIQKQILATRKKIKEAYERKQALESERLRKVSEEKEKTSNEGAIKEDGLSVRSKEKKTKGEDGKQKSGAANVAARSAAGVNDMLLKWQMMAEQGRQKREGESGASTITDASGTRNSRDVDKKQIPPDVKASTRMVAEGGPITGTAKRIPGDVASKVPPYQAKSMSSLAKPPPRRIITKDLIAFLETEPQMAKSSLLYRLYDKNLSTSQAA